MLSEKAQKIWQLKYAITKKDGTKETWEEGIFRVAHYVASAEKEYGADDTEVMELAKDYYRMMINKMFIPGGRILANAGTNIRNNFNCFILPIGDSRQEIYQALGDSGEIFAHGGGIGYNFSDVREKDASVKGTGGKASGPLSFMELFDTTGEVISQASRRGAQMGILDCDHPDIQDFIDFKAKPNAKNVRLISEISNSFSANFDNEGFVDSAQAIVESVLVDNQLTHFNISVGLTDAFMEAVINDEDWNLTSRVDGSVVKTIKAKDLMRQIAESAWRSGDPGVIFLDKHEKGNMTPYLGKIKATNPCAEIGLLPYEPCCLGSINLAEMIEDGVISEKKLAWVTTMAIRFLDNVHTLNYVPVEKVNQAAKQTRRLGLGVMGWADTLVKLGVPYDSQEGLALAEEIMKSIDNVAWGTSHFLAEERGSFEAYNKNNIVPISPHILNDAPLRNVAVSAIAPTGSIALLCDVNSGIEPFFALTYTRYITEGVGNVIKDKIVEVNPHVEQFLKDNIVLESERQEIRDHLLKYGDFPEKAYGADIFSTAGNISWKAHIDMQAAFQKWTSNAVSKTINMPNEATIEDIENAYIYSWQAGLKSVALYRDGSKSFQILNK
jgi:ribonucleoside-diphosphate reductase alpha chain